MWGHGSSSYLRVPTSQIFQGWFSLPHKITRLIDWDLIKNDQLLQGQACFFIFFFPRHSVYMFTVLKTVTSNLDSPLLAVMKTFSSISDGACHWRAWETLKLDGEWAWLSKNHTLKTWCWLAAGVSAGSSPPAGMGLWLTPWSFWWFPQLSRGQQCLQASLCTILGHTRCSASLHHPTHLSKSWWKTLMWLAQSSPLGYAFLGSDCRIQ